MESASSVPEQEDEMEAMWQATVAVSISTTTSTIHAASNVKTTNFVQAGMEDPDRCDITILIPFFKSLEEHAGNRLENER